MENSIQQIFEDILEKEVSFSWDMNRREFSQWNFLNHIKIMVAIEKLLQIRFSTEEVIKIETPQDILSLISSHRIDSKSVFSSKSKK